MIVTVGMKVLHKNKQTTYKVIAIGIHTETKEEMVVYVSLQDNKTWIRPLKMFIDGRFEECAS